LKKPYVNSSKLTKCTEGNLDVYDYIMSSIGVGQFSEEKQGVGADSG